MRTFTFGDQTIQMHALGEALDAAFDRFYGTFLSEGIFDSNGLLAPANDYFTQQPTSPDAHNAYFENFTPAWRSLLQGWQYTPAEYLWGHALEPALEWERANSGKRLHKGTAYYFWAMTAILRRDMDRGYLIIHRAVEEDILTLGEATPDTPGYALVSLNHEKADQAFRKWVVAQSEYVQRLLDGYNATYHRTVTLDDLRRKFLTCPPSIDTLFLFTYTLARLMNVADVPDHVRRNGFAGQLELNLFFDLALMIDSTVKAKTQTRYFIDHAYSLLATAGTGISIEQLRDVNGQFLGDFDATLKAALDGTLAVNGVALDRLQSDVALAYGVRNRGAHSTDAADTVWEQFREVEQALFRVFFAAIDHLYGP